MGTSDVLDLPLSNLIQSLLQIKMRRGCTDDDICEFFLYTVPQFPPVNLNIYPTTFYNHMDAVMMYCDRDLDPPCIMETVKVKIFALNYIIT